MCSTAIIGSSTISTKDFSQYNDLAAKEPGKLKELQDLFLVEAAKYQVFPLDNSVATRFGQQPSTTTGRDTFTYTGELSGLPARLGAQHPD